MPKKRAMITVDADQWDKLQRLLKEKGYPKDAMSFYLGACLTQLEARLDDDPSLYSCASPFFDLDVHAKGIETALIEHGFKVVKDDLKSEK